MKKKLIEQMKTTGRSCEMRDVLDRIASKWPALAICALAAKPCRYCELQRELEGITQKMLTQTLRNLEHDGLIARTVVRQIPPRVEYRLTRLGKSLHAPLSGVCKWAHQHREKFPVRRGKAS